MKYLTVGTSEITRDKFINIEDTEADNMKPRGGLWLTKYHDEKYNEWVDFILEDPVVLYYKSKDRYSIWEQPCSLVTLNEEANIYELDSEMGLDFLKYRFPLADNKFSYKELSKEYDGIYVDLYKLLMDVDSETRQRLYKFGVNSLILFNTDCIEYYQPGVVNIEPFDFEYDHCEVPSYEIKVNDVKKRILMR